MDEDEESELAAELKSLAPKRMGEARISADADRSYREFYLSHRERLLRGGEREATFLARVTTILAKVALLLATSEKSIDRTDRIVVTLEHVDRAANVAAYFERSAQWLLDNMVWSKDYSEKLRILGIAQRYCRAHEVDAMPYARLLRNSHMKAASLKSLLDTLVAEETLVSTKLNGKDAFAPFADKFAATG